MTTQGDSRKRKVKCPVCGRQVSLTSAGFLRVHKRDHWSGIGLYAECRASRWAPSYVIERLKTEPGWGRA